MGPSVGAVHHARRGRRADGIGLDEDGHPLARVHLLVGRVVARVPVPARPGAAVDMGVIVRAVVAVPHRAPAVGENFHGVADHRAAGERTEIDVPPVMDTEPAVGPHVRGYPAPAAVGAVDHPRARGAAGGRGFDVDPDVVGGLDEAVLRADGNVPDPVERPNARGQEQQQEAGRDGGGGPPPSRISVKVLHHGRRLNRSSRTGASGDQWPRAAPRANCAFSRAPSRT